MAAERHRGERRPWRRRDVGDEAGLARLSLAHHDRGLPHPGRRVQGLLDLSRVHRGPMDLHARVAPPPELQPAVRTKPAEIAGPIDPRVAARRVGQERARGEIRLPPVAEGEVAAPECDLAGLAMIERAARLVQDEDLVVVGGRAGADRPLGQLRVRRHQHAGGGAGLGGAEAAEEHAAGREVPAKRREVGGGERLAAGAQHADAREPLVG